MPPPRRARRPAAPRHAASMRPRRCPARALARCAWRPARVASTAPYAQTSKQAGTQALCCSCAACWQGMYKAWPHPAGRCSDVELEIQCPYVVGAPVCQQGKARVEGRALGAHAHNTTAQACKRLSMQGPLKQGWAGRPPPQLPSSAVHAAQAWPDGLAPRRAHAVQARPHDTAPRTCSAVPCHATSHRGVYGELKEAACQLIQLMAAWMPAACVWRSTSTARLQAWAIGHGSLPSAPARSSLLSGLSACTSSRRHPRCRALPAALAPRLPAP